MTKNPRDIGAVTLFGVILVAICTWLAGALVLWRPEVADQIDVPLWGVAAGAVAIVLGEAWEAACGVS